ncbi:MAG: LCP family protein [Propionibacteriaceae bacterium]
MESRTPPVSDAQRDSDRVKLRRGLGFLGMTLVLPGSAQLAAGNKRVGRVALRTWVGLWITALVLLLLALVWRDGAISLIAWPPTLRVLQVVLILLAVGWAGLFVDAWRISRPPELARQHRLGFALLNLVLVALVAGGLIATSSIVNAQRDFVTSVFAGGGDKEEKDGRINVLLLGGDAGANRVGVRPDSINVASVDVETGRTVLFSLPRNLEDIPFPEDSPLHALYPDGYSCEDHSCLLNSVYTLANEHADLYPGVKDPGAQATKEAVEAITGLEINYYALVELGGFEALVDAVGGITLDINKRIPIGGGSSPVKGYIEPGEDVHLDGYHALWFARSRHGSSDYERMDRQKCVMSAMLNQLDPVTVLTKFNEIAGAGKEIVATDVPGSEINSLMELALLARETPVSSVSFVPPLVYPGNPKYDVIRDTVRDKIAAAEAKDEKSADPGGEDTKKPKDDSTDDSGDKESDAPAEPEESEQPKSEDSATPEGGQTPKPQTDDLAEVCSVG